MQTDSMMVKNIVGGTWVPPWTVVDYVEEINDLMERCNVRITHITREANKLADYLANYALDSGDIEVHAIDQLGAQGKRVVTSDKLQCPYLRVRVARG